MKKKKEEKSCCVLTLPLLTELWQEHIIEKRFAIMEHMKNQLIGIELRKLKNLERTRAYRELKEKIRAEKDEAEQKKLYGIRSKMLKDAGFSEFAFMDDIQCSEKKRAKSGKMQFHFSEHIATHIAHQAASDVWRSFEKYLFSDGQEVHLHRQGTLESVACKENGNGMTYRAADNLFIWSGGKNKEHPNQIKLVIRVEAPQTEYERQMLQKPIARLRIVRRWSKTRYKYYLQITLKGKPVRKERRIGTGRVGIDLGTRTVAIASASQVRLLELADRVNNIEKKKRLIQQKMDRSRRALNTEKYNPDGTIRKIPRKNRTPWVESGHYRKLKNRQRELDRKNADIRTYQHTCLANEILSLGDQIYVEKMYFSGLQRRAKETRKGEDGRFKKKKRFGKSIANKAPGEFLRILKTKAATAGGRVEEVDTQNFRASQLDHTSETYRKALLSERWKQLSDGSRVQRDLYSAYLLMNSKTTLEEADLDLCRDGFENFLKLHDGEINRIRKENRKHPDSFGF